MPGVLRIDVAAELSHFLPTGAIEQIQGQILAGVQSAFDQPIETQLALPYGVRLIGAAIVIVALEAEPSTSAE